MKVISNDELERQNAGIYRTGSYSDKMQAAIREGRATEDDLPVERPSFFTQVLPAALQRDNFVVSTIMDEGLFHKFDRKDFDYHAEDHLAAWEGTQYEDMMLGAKNAEHMEALQDYANRASKNDAIMAKAPMWQRVLAGVIAGVVSPEVALPAGSVVKGVKSGISIGKTAASAGAWGAGSMSISEAGLQLTQYDRTAGESAANIASGLVLGGLLGGAAGILTKAQFNDLAGRTMRDFQQMSRPAEASEEVIPVVQSAEKEGGDGASPAGADVTGRDDWAIEEMKVQGKVAQWYSAVKANLPYLRSRANILLESDNVEVRRALLKMSGASYMLEGNKTRASYEAAETIKHKVGHAHAQWANKTKKIYTKYKKDARKRGEKPMTFSAFNDAISYASNHADRYDGNPFVEEASRLARSMLFEPLGADAVNLRVFTKEDLEPRFAESFSPHQYSQQKLISDREGAMDMLKAWAEKETRIYVNATREAMSAVQSQINHLKAKGKKAGIDKLEEKYLRMRLDLDAALDPDGEGIAESVQELASAMYKKLAYGEQSGVFIKTPADIRGPLKERVLDIPYDVKRQFLDTRADRVFKRYSQAMGAELGLAKAFGEPPKLEAMYKKIDDEMDRLVAEAAPKDRVKLAARLANEKRMIEDIHNRIRGIEPKLFADGWLTQPRQMAKEAKDVLKDWVMMTTLGDVAHSSLPDLARPIMIHGLSRVFGEAYRNFLSLSNKSLRKLKKDELEFLGFNAEASYGAAVKTLVDVTDSTQRGGAASKLSGIATEKFSALTMLPMMNNFTKNFSAGITNRRILAAATAKKITQKEKTYLHYLGFNDSDIEQIGINFDKHGSTESGTYFANVQKWDDHVLVEKYTSALRKEVDNIIITQSIADKPEWADYPMLDLVFQLKGFVWASDQRTTMRALSDANAAAVMGLASSVAIGMLISQTKAAVSDHIRGLAGYDVKDREFDLKSAILDGIDRSGVVAQLFHVNNIAGLAGIKNIEQWMGADSPSRYRQDLGPMSIAGPWLDRAWGAPSAAIGIARDMMDPDDPVKQRDIRALKQAIPYNQLIWARDVFAILEGKTNELLDAE